MGTGAVGRILLPTGLGRADSLRSREAAGDNAQPMGGRGHAGEFNQFRSAGAALQRLLSLTPPRKGGPTESTTRFLTNLSHAAQNWTEANLMPERRASKLCMFDLEFLSNIGNGPSHRRKIAHDVLQNSGCMLRQADD